MAHFRHTPALADIEKQIHWEIEGVERGAKRVREQMEEQKVADGAVGMFLIQRIAPRLIKRIEEAQKEAREGLTSGVRGRPSPWWWLISLLDADKLAVIILKSVLSAKPRQFSFNQAITAAASNINRNVHIQVDFDVWKEEQGQKPREENEFLKYLSYTKNVDAKSFRRFSERQHRLRLEKWDHKDGINFGTVLIKFLVDAVPEWFSIDTVRLKGGRYEKQLVMSEEAREVVGNVAEQSELSRPMLLPTIVPPADWRIAA